ncbi:MAG TPA: glycosyltransferase, partial [Terriglobales bacterium]
MSVPLSVIILTHNEETNIAQALKSVCGWADQVFVVDSYSTDRTVEIAGDWGATVVQNRWPGYAAQKNWALDNLQL